MGYRQDGGQLMVGSKDNINRHCIMTMENKNINGGIYGKVQRC